MKKIILIFLLSVVCSSVHAGWVVQTAKNPIIAFTNQAGFSYNTLFCGDSNATLCLVEAILWNTNTTAGSANFFIDNGDNYNQFNYSCSNFGSSIQYRFMQVIQTTNGSVRFGKGSSKTYWEGRLVGYYTNDYFVASTNTGGTNIVDTSQMVEAIQITGQYQQDIRVALLWLVGLTLGALCLKYMPYQ